jgi:hypothetical protein
MDAAALRKLGLSEFMIAHLEKDDLDAPLGYRCQPPCYWETSPLAKRGIIPLWECGMVIWYFNPETKMFENCSLENIGDVWHRYASLQSVLAELFLELYEDEAEIEEVRGLARSAGFHHIDRMLTEAAANQGDTNGDWREKFSATCI